MRVFGIAETKRVASLPDVPIMPELGFANMKSRSWGVYVTAGTPRPIVEKLFSALIKVLSDPEVIRLLNSNGAKVVTSKSPEEFGVFMRTENEKWGKLIKEVGIVME